MGKIKTMATLIFILFIILLGAIFYISYLQQRVSKIRQEEIKKTEERRSSFISIISHQLRTPLSIIRGYLEALVTGDQGKLNDGQREYLDEALKIDLDTIKLVNDYLKAVRLDTEEIVVKLEPLDLYAIVKMEVNKLAPLAKASNCELKLIEPSNNLPKVLADPIKIKQVIENILTNAIKYTDGKGQATISLSYQEGKVQFLSKDNGVGIPQGEQEEIFSKFYRGKNVIGKDTQGSGLGLYLAKMIIKALHGKIWLVSEENKGTSVYFQLPTQS